MLLHDEKRQRRLRRLAKQNVYAKRLRIPKMHVSSVPTAMMVEENWWTRLIRFFKSFFK